MFKKNLKRLLRPDEYEKLGIDPRLADILKLTTIDAEPMSKRDFQKMDAEMRSVKLR